MDEREPTCQICGYITGTTDGDGCPVCNWECSWFQEDHRDAKFDPNRTTSLREAQEYFLKFDECDAQSASFLAPVEQRAARFQKDPNWKPRPPASTT